MPVPPIDDSYIDAIIKSDGPYNPALNRTQGVKLRELMKRFRDYFEEQTPKLISQLANDSGYVTSSIIDGLASDVNVLHKTGDEAKSGNLFINGSLQVSSRVDLNGPLNVIGGMIVDSSNDGRNMDLRLAYNNDGIWIGLRVEGETKTISAGYFPFNNSVIFDGRNIYDNTGVHFLKEGDAAPISGSANYVQNIQYPNPKQIGAGILIDGAIKSFQDDGNHFQYENGNAGITGTFSANEVWISNAGLLKTPIITSTEAGSIYLNPQGTVVFESQTGQNFIFRSGVNIEGLAGSGNQIVIADNAGNLKAGIVNFIQAYPNAPQDANIYLLASNQITFGSGEVAASISTRFHEFPDYLHFYEKRSGKAILKLGGYGSGNGNTVLGQRLLIDDTREGDLAGVARSLLDVYGDFTANDVFVANLQGEGNRVVIANEYGNLKVSPIDFIQVNPVNPQTASIKVVGEIRTWDNNIISYNGSDASFTLLNPGGVGFKNNAEVFTGYLSNETMTNNRQWTLPDKSGKLALTQQAIDLEITDSAKGIVLKSPNGTRYRVSVDDAGALTTSAL